MTTEAMAPPSTKSQVLRSFDVADFPALNGLEEEWRFTPIKRLGELITAGALTGAAPVFDAGDLLGPGCPSPRSTPARSIRC
nr:hypothetical protein GCM10020092_084350 [Actinoplanes digitatis]